MESCTTHASLPLVNAAVARRRRAASSRAGRSVGAAAGTRVGLVERATKETSVSVRIDLDGTGVCVAASGIPFLDHMLDVRARRTAACAQSALLSPPRAQQIASHGLFDITVRATGDLHIDDHHTNEDIALAFGAALAQALGDRKGIVRFGDFAAPLDEALIHVVLVRARLPMRVVLHAERVARRTFQGGPTCPLTATSPPSAWAATTPSWWSTSSPPWLPPAG